jgi:hypothetical protein
VFQIFYTTTYPVWLRMAYRRLFKAVLELYLVSRSPKYLQRTISNGHSALPAILSMSFLPINSLSQLR